MKATVGKGKRREQILQLGPSLTETLDATSYAFQKQGCPTCLSICIAAALGKRSRL